MEWITKTPIAHRGLHTADNPENSMGAFKAAQAANYAIELDLRLSKDGEIVVFHDETLERMTGKSGFVEQMSADELCGIRLKGGDETIVSLERVFQEITAPICLEIKRCFDDQAMRKRLLELTRRYKPQCVFASFEPMTLINLRKSAPEIARGMISCDFRGAEEKARSLLERKRLQYLAAICAVRPSFISYAIDSLPFWVTSAYRKMFKIPLIAWTARSQEEAEMARRFADNVIFEGFMA
ncbi:MAG: hypothetical protein LBN32_00760 [Helicobacteraceae bacterium]|jgi:glycerophosphoryl diester phosphodiesterase|nr:hypothetical protein [Helicobacteraceae bacterium]